MTEQAALSFGGLLRQLRAEARLTQEELAEAAQLSPRSISDLERGINRTARKDTAELLAEALGLAEPLRTLFVAAARGRGHAEDVLAAREGRTSSAGHQAARWARGCPYRGLLPFDESDADVFYGRERLAVELAVKLAARAATGGLVVVTGASGSGKSSLLRAGLLPILARGQQIPGSDRWPRVVMTPTKDPVTELAARPAALGGPDALAVREGLAQHPDGAHLAIRSAVLAAAARRDEELRAPDEDVARLVLVVDQFEQVFTLNPNLDGEAAGQTFITALCSAATTPVGPEQAPSALVVLAVRGDFWDRCAAVPELVGELQEGQFVVGPMTESELRVAITGPAGAAGLRIDPVLIETILGDLRVAGGDRTAGVLPLLSQAMALTWEQREGDRLTSRGYAQAGGVSHAVQTAADRVYDTLSARHQAIARDVLRSMTVASRDGGLARRPVTRNDLYARQPGTARADIDAVLDAFATERLTILDEDTAQLSHDVLLRAWPQLRGWLEEDQADWILYSQVGDAAAAWHDSGEDASFLYRGAQLGALQQAIARWSANPARSPALTGTQRAFLLASGRAAARGIPRLLDRSSADGGASVNSVAFSPNGHTLASGADDGTVRLWNVANPANSRPLKQPQTTNRVALDAVAFSPDGHTLASGDSQGVVRLWDLADPAHPSPLSQPPTGGTGTVLSLAFSPDGHTLACSDEVGTVRLWDVADPAHPSPLSQPLNNGGVAVHSVAFSPGGQTLASGSGDGTIRLWSLPQTTMTSSAIAVNTVVIGRDGHTLASADFNGGLRLWDVTDPAHPRPSGQSLISAGSGGNYSVAISPDGHLIATGSRDGTLRLWNITDPAKATMLSQHPSGSSSPIGAMAFSPDGRTLASSDYDGTLRLWDTADPAHPRPSGQPLTNGGIAIYSVAISPDGRTLASGNDDGTVPLWDITDPAHPRPLGHPLVDGSSIFIDSVAFSPGRHILAAGSGDGVIRLWNLDVRYAIERICAIAGGLTPRQWHKYIPQLRYQPSCRGH